MLWSQLTCLQCSPPEESLRENARYISGDALSPAGSGFSSAMRPDSAPWRYLGGVSSLRLDLRQPLASRFQAARVDIGPDEPATLQCTSRRRRP